jgi:hypothetical protein
MDGIQAHMASQSERSEAMVRSLDRLANGIRDMSQTSQAHLELLSGISEAAQADAASAKRLEEGLLQLPQLADGQREAMVSIGRQLDMYRQTDERIAEAMEGFRQAITSLGDTVEASGKALQEMRWDATAREERVASLLLQQTKWLVTFGWSAISLAAIAAIVGLIALFR